MFTGFTEETGRFLWELAFNNERPWFMAHKDRFERCLNQPFKALAEETHRQMCLRYPQMDCLVHTARIYRDARRLHGKGPYKDHLWFSIKSGAVLLHGPMFWFEIGAANYSFGMGFYDVTATQLEVFRRKVDANPARFERLAAGIERCPEFTVSGEEYKKPKGDRGALINKWYNRRRLGADCTRDFGAELFDPGLPLFLADEFSKLMPMYEFFMEFFAESQKETAPEKK